MKPTNEMIRRLIPLCEQGVELSYPYGKTYAQTIGEQD